MASGTRKSFSRSFSQGEDDDWWNESEAIKGKGIFEEDEWENTKKIKDKMQKNLFENEADTTINFDGTPSSDTASVGYTTSKYKVPSPAGSASSVSSTGGQSVQRALHPPGGSTVGQTTRSASSVHSGLLNTQQHQMSSSMAMNSQHNSIREAMTSDVPKKIKTEETKNLQKQILCLERNLQSEKRKLWEKHDIDDTVKRLVTGEVYFLETFRSLEDKLELLDKTIKTHDGNAIITAVLFLRDTLKKKIFNQELSTRPVAVNQYLSYLKQHYDINELIDMLGMLGRTEEAAMLKYKQVINIKNPESKIRSIINCHRTHFQADGALADEAGHLTQHISLLERQLPIDKDDSESQALIFRQHTRKASLIGTSVITTLYYCCFYHYELQENSLASPIAIRKSHNLNEKQFIWVALNALSRLKKWTALETLLTSKGWFGSTKMKSVIGFEKIVDMLHKNKSPYDIVARYLKLIDDTDKRLELAQKYKSHIVVIDILVNMKDRQQLSNYKNSVIDRHTREDIYAEDALRNSSIKWKN